MLSLLPSHQGLSGRSGPRGERGPTVSAVGRPVAQDPKGCVGFSDNSSPSSRVHAVSGDPGAPLESLELRLVVLAGLPQWSAPDLSCPQLL